MLDYRLAELNQALAQFVADARRLGFWSRSTIVIMSELGRTIRENATVGTDHGRGGVAMVLGPTVTRSKLLTPGGTDLGRLADATRAIDSRDETNDPFNAIPMAYDLRHVVGEVLLKNYAMSGAELDGVFPGMAVRPTLALLT